MATPEIRVEQSRTFAVVRQSSQKLNVFQGVSLAVYNIPADEIQVTQAAWNYVQRRVSQQMHVSQAAVLAVAKGRITSPKLRAWGFTLDGHEFFVLKLGTGGKTLVYDLTTKQWSWWSTGDLPGWRATVGMNWDSSGTIPGTFGSNVVVGDDSSGTLWVLNPDRGTDGSHIDDEPRTFPRVSMAQIPTRGRDTIQVFGVYLTASLGEPATPQNVVTLDYSDDQGRTYVKAEVTHTAVEGDYEQEFSWRNLGLVRAPGRLFRVTDNGAFARVDSLDINPNSETK